MTREPIVLDGAPAEAYGHPSACTEPAPGSVSVTSNSVSVNGTDVATIATAQIDFPSHAHAYEDTSDPPDGIPDTCTNFQSHSIDPSIVSESVTVNGSPMYVDSDSAEGTDPGSGGRVEITGTGGNTSVDEVT